MAIPTVALDDVDLVIQAGRSARIGADDFRLDNDQEYRLLRRLAGGRARYLMLSTRAVYGPAGPGPLRETDAPAPASAYACNKLALERAATKALGERACIARLSNVFGFEWPGRRTFFGTMLTSLKDQGVIRFDMAGETERDFLPVELAATALARLATTGASGVVNVGAGFSLPCAALAQSLIDGFGSGRLAIDTDEPSDTFWMDTSRLAKLTGLRTTSASVLAAAHDAGRRLRGHHADVAPVRPAPPPRSV